MARSSRGASYMDQYESSYDHGGKYDDSPDDDELSTAATCSKNCLFFGMDCIDYNLFNISMQLKKSNK